MLQNAFTHPTKVKLEGPNFLLQLLCSSYQSNGKLNKFGMACMVSDWN